MLKKWEKLRLPIERKRGDFPLSVTEKIPTVPECVMLERLTVKLGDFESVSKALQRGGDKRLSRYEMRGLFDDLVSAHETADRPLHHLHENDNVVNDKAFEKAIVKLQGGKEDQLTTAEKNVVKFFKKPQSAAAEDAAEPEMSFSEKSLLGSQLSKRAHTDKSSYRSVSHVTSTSLICERLFSRAKQIMSHLRSHMDPDSLAMLLFLEVNKRFWKDATIIDDIFSELASGGQATNEI